MENNITLREAALELGINKSKLHYYASIGLLEPKSEVSGTFLFNKKELFQKIKKIGSIKKKKKHTLLEIKDMLKK